MYDAVGEASGWSAWLRRPEVAIAQVRPVTTPAQPATVSGSGGDLSEGAGNGHSGTEPGAPAKMQPRRFYGSVEIDMVRPVKAFDAILNAVAIELQRTNGARVTLTVEPTQRRRTGSPKLISGSSATTPASSSSKGKSTGFK